MLLLLFDIDGTLLQGAAVEHAHALRTAAAAVHGLEALDAEVEVAGRTDRAIARDLLAHAGVTEILDWEAEAVTVNGMPSASAVSWSSSKTVGSSVEPRVSTAPVPSLWRPTSFSSIPG